MIMFNGMFRRISNQIFNTQITTKTIDDRIFKFHRLHSVPATDPISKCGTWGHALCTLGSLPVTVGFLEPTQGAAQTLPSATTPMDATCTHQCISWLNRLGTIRKPFPTIATAGYHREDSGRPIESQCAPRLEPAQVLSMTTTSTCNSRQASWGTLRVIQPCSVSQLVRRA